MERQNNLMEILSSLRVKIEVLQEGIEPEAIGVRLALLGSFHNSYSIA